MLLPISIFAFLAVLGARAEISTDCPLILCSEDRSHYLVKTDETIASRPVWQSQDPDNFGVPTTPSVYLYYFAEDNVWNLSTELRVSKSSRLGFAANVSNTRSDCPLPSTTWLMNKSGVNTPGGVLKHSDFPLQLSGVRNYWFQQTSLDLINERHVWRAVDPYTGSSVVAENGPVYMVWFAIDRVWNLTWRLSEPTSSHLSRYGYIHESEGRDPYYPMSGDNYLEWVTKHEILGKIERAVCPATTTTTTPPAATTPTTVPPTISTSTATPSATATKGSSGPEEEALESDDGLSNAVVLSVAGGAVAMLAGLGVGYGYFAVTRDQDLEMSEFIEDSIFDEELGELDQDSVDAYV